MRRQLRAEIAAQFAAFAATGLRLDHANAHKHMHLHPTVGRMLIEEGGGTGCRPSASRPSRRRHGALGARRAGRPGAVSLDRVLRRQARRAGLRTNDHVFGIAWSGHMTADRLLRLGRVCRPG